MSEALKSLKVLDLSMNLPGPYMTWLMASLGAEVIKVENPVGGDYARALGGLGGSNSPFFEAVNRNKKSVSLNLKHPQGREIFLDLLDHYDIVVEGFRPGTMERFGLGFDELSKRQPRLIQVSISGYGQDGPFRLRAGHDLNYLSLAGVTAMTGPRSGEPAIIGVQVADLAGGSLLALSGLLAAVIQRQTTGKGQYVDTSMFHGALSLATMVYAAVEKGAEEPAPGKMILTGRFPCYGIYETSDGRHFSLGAIEFKFWKNFCEAVARPDLMGEQYGGPEIVEEVSRIFASKTFDEWRGIMESTDACCEPVIPLDEAVKSDLVRDRGMMEKGFDNGERIGSPFRLSKSPPAKYEPSPKLGEHTMEILAKLDLAGERLQELKNEGVI
jgi:crotonobetainyl-CoA:carnitine CoA-transferase CaiB-like acyl-CoA transferase